MTDKIVPDVTISADEEITVDAPENQYYWTQEAEEQRRCFVFEHLADPEIDVYVLLENMQKCIDWITTGQVPLDPKKAGAHKRGLKAVENDGKA